MSAPSIEDISRGAIDYLEDRTRLLGAIQGRGLLAKGVHDEIVLRSDKKSFIFFTSPLGDDSRP